VVASGPQLAMASGAGRRLSSGYCQVAWQSPVLRLSPFRLRLFRDGFCFHWRQRKLAELRAPFLSVFKVVLSPPSGERQARSRPSPKLSGQRDAELHDIDSYYCNLPPHPHGHGHGPPPTARPSATGHAALRLHGRGGGGLGRGRHARPRPWALSPDALSLSCLTPARDGAVTSDRAAKPTAGVHQFQSLS
jgi:hypothetical protein